MPAERILFLDDSGPRHSLFRAQYPDAVRVWSARDAKLTLAMYPAFDTVWLDHDLGEGRPDGMTVVDYIVHMDPALRPRLVVVHSHNHPAAVGRMIPALKAAGVPVRHQPFAMGRGIPR